MEIKLKPNRQYRMAEMFTFDEDAAQRRIESDYYVEGYATTFSPYVLYLDYDGNEVRELFTRDAFKDTDMSDVIFQLNHEGRVYARQSNGSLIVEPDEHGLFTAVDLSRTESAREIHSEIASGMLTRMSWGFLPGEYHFDRKTRTITHESVRKVFDVSVVAIPANDQTEIHARTFADGVIEKVMQEWQKRERKRQQIRLQILLRGFEK